MKNLFLFLLFIFPLSANAQGLYFDPSQIGSNISSLTMGVRVAETSGFGKSGKLYEESSSSYLYLDHAKDNPYASKAFINPRDFNMYNYWETRRINAYYDNRRNTRTNQTLSK